jgi:hypothetical protein
MVISCQNSEGAVPLAQAAQAVRKYFADANYCGKRVLLIVPDNTRSGPIGEIFQMIFDGLEGRAAAVGVLFALGTHQPMTEEQMCKRLALSAEHRKGRYAGVKFFNHEWDSPRPFARSARFPPTRLEKSPTDSFANRSMSPSTS